MAANPTNPWVSYLSRSYTQIKNSILNKLSTYAPELTDRSESNPLVIIIGMISGIAEMLNYYIDQIAREAFITTARRYSSLVKLAKYHDYRIHASVPSSVDVEFVAVDSNGDPVILASDYVIPLGTVISNGSMQFLTTSLAVIPAGSSSVIVGAIQQTQYTNVNLGTTSGLPDQKIALNEKYADNTLSITIGSEVWEYRESLSRSSIYDKHFTVQIAEDKTIYLTFGDGTYGAIPTSGLTILGNYYLTEGANGNVTADAITTLPSWAVPIGVAKFTVTNHLASTGGSGLESLEELRDNIVYSLRTLDRAVTKQDYIDLAKLCPGVSKATVIPNCGNIAVVYITPVGGGIAQTPLLNAVKDYLDNRRMITTTISVLPAGESYIGVKLTAVVKFRRDPIQALADIKNALLEAYAISTSEINKAIYVSDIIALVDNLDKIEYLQLENLYLIPYARPIQHTNPLYWEISITPNAAQNVISWRLMYMGSYFLLFMDEIPTNLTILPNTTYSDPLGIITFKVLSTAYAYGDSWAFVTHPTGTDIIVSDNTIPIAIEDYLDITVIPNNVQNN